MKIKFKQSSKNVGKGKILGEVRLYLDDKDITNSCASFNFNSSAGSISTVILELKPSDIEIESEDFKLTTNDFTLNDMLEAFTREASTYIKNKSEIKLVEVEDEE